MIHIVQHDMNNVLISTMLMYTMCVWLFMSLIYTNSILVIAIIYIVYCPFGSSRKFSCMSNLNLGLTSNELSSTQLHFLTYCISYQILVSVLFSRTNHKDIVTWLVNECRCDPNVRDNDGETPLHYACR